MVGAARVAISARRADFSRLYPDEREHIDEGNLAKAIEAFALDPEGKPGRKRKGGASKHELLKLAFVGESFIRRDTDLETAYRRAKSRREARKARAKEREKRSGLSADDDA